MSDSSFASLVHEVERIVTAPYVPSLQTLRDLTQNISPEEVCSWSSCKPCQVGLLVDVLVEALSRSDIALELLCTFAILDKFLEQAIDHEEAKYIPACISLLLSPLPANFIVPARLAPFIMKLVGRMAKNPYEETLSPLCKVMTGLQGTPGILNEMPSETMSNLQVELTKALRNLDDHMGNLLCLAIFARITKAEIQHGPKPPAWLESIHHFFGPKRGLKTLDLVVLRVILACSASCTSLGPGKAAESIRLAIEICNNVDPDRKRAWVESNSPKIKKLCEKVIRDDIDPKVQMMGITFLICVLQVAPRPEIPRLGLHGLVSMSSRRVLEVVPSEFIPRLVEAIAISVGEPAIYSFLNYILCTLKTEGSMDDSTIAGVKLAALLLSGLRKLESHSFGSRSRELASSSGQETILELLDHFPKQSSQTCGGTIACYTELSTSENQLLVEFLDFCSLPPSLDIDPSTPETKVLAVFMKQIRKSLPGNKCAFAAAKPPEFRDSFSLPSRRQDSSTSYPRRDWRAGIVDTVTANAHSLHENMMKLVQEICEDVEHRCFNTEAPLKAVEEQRDKLSSEVEDLKQQKAELEDGIQQASDTIAHLQPEMTRLKKHAETAHARGDELAAKLEELQKELKEQRHSFEETARKQGEKARTRELDFIAILTEKEDQLEELQEEIEELRAENGDVRRTLDSVSKEKAACLENSVSLRQEMTKLKEFVESSKQATAARDAEIQQLLAERECTRVEAETLRKQLEEATTGSNGLRSALSEAEKHFEREMEVVKQQYELQLSNANAECVKRGEANKSLRFKMRVAASNANRELQSKDRKIQQLEKKAQSLQDERAATVREFKEAQQHMGRLMSVMGLQESGSESKISTKHRPTLRTPQGSAMQRKMHAEETDRQTEPDIPLDESFESVTSSSSSPTPKRSKGHHSLQRTPSTPSRSSCSQKTKVLPTRSRTGEQQERRPLREADQNSPLKSQRRGILKNSSAGISDENRVHPHQNENAQDIDLDTDLDFSKDLSSMSTSFWAADGQYGPFEA